MSIQSAVMRAFQKKWAGGWEKYPQMYWAIDLHGVILRSTYTRKEDMSGQEIPPAAIRVLKFLSDQDNHCLILFTASMPDYLMSVENWFHNLGIHFKYVNHNADVKSEGYCNVDQKFYFDVLLDDKAGFEMNSDWDEIERTLKAIGEWK